MAVLVINLLVVASALMLSNEWLMLHGYLMFAVQALVLRPSLAWRVLYAHDVFMPSLDVIFILVTCHTVRQLATTLVRSVLCRSHSSGLVSIGCIGVSRPYALDRLASTRGTYS